jgi:hypothetical protein
MFNIIRLWNVLESSLRCLSTLEHGFRWARDLTRISMRELCRRVSRCSDEKAKTEVVLEHKEHWGQSQYDGMEIAASLYLSEPFHFALLSLKLLRAFLWQSLVPHGGLPFRTPSFPFALAPSPFTLARAVRLMMSVARSNP